MATREIRTSDPHTACDICGRTLLRGERAAVYLSGGDRHSVCDLCTTRALHEGWVREGTVPPYDGSGAASLRRRSLLGRLRKRRDSQRSSAASAPSAEDYDDIAYPEVPPPASAPDPPRRAREPELAARSRGRVREPRHVRAIPTSAEQKIASAIEVFNGSEHTRTVAGVARSLGMPTVSVRPAQVPPSLVTVVASWELCWYRYEVDLSDELSSVRLVAQGYELDELEPVEREQNALADENGALKLS